MKQSSVPMKLGRLKLIILMGLVVGLAACSGGGSGDANGFGGNNGGGGTASPSTGRTFLIKPGPNATSEMVAAMIEAKPRDVISN